MNFWGFTPALFDEIERRFPAFLANGLNDNPQAEMLVPNLVGELLREGLCTVDVMRSDDVWHGMTYREDKPEVMAAVRAPHSRGQVPRKALEIMLYIKRSPHGLPCGLPLPFEFQSVADNGGARGRDHEHTVVAAEDFIVDIDA